MHKTKEIETLSKITSAGAKKIVTLRLPIDLDMVITEEAEQLGVSKTLLVTTALEDGFASAVQKLTKFTDEQNEIKHDWEAKKAAIARKRAELLGRDLTDDEAKEHLDAARGGGHVL